MTDSGERISGTSRGSPRNVTWWRFPYRRLEVEAIRDSMLSVSGQLRRPMGGPGIYLEIPPEVLAQYEKAKSLFDIEEARRRLETEGGQGVPLAEVWRRIHAGEFRPSPSDFACSTCPALDLVCAGMRLREPVGALELSAS